MAFPSINPLAAARLISLGCSLSELLGLNDKEQRQLAVKLSDIPRNSLELFFQQAMYGQPVTGHMQPLAITSSHMGSHGKANFKVLKSPRWAVG